MKVLRSRGKFITFLFFIFIVSLFSFFFIHIRKKNSEDIYNLSTNKEFKGADTNTAENDSKNIEENSVTSSTEKGASKKDDNYYKTRKFFDWNKSCSRDLILLNDYNPIPKGVYPDLKDYGKFKVSSGILDCLDRMIKAAGNDGIKLWVSSCYRSLDYQKWLYQKKIDFFVNKGYEKKEAEKKASTIVAIPGTSEHNLGIAVDFNDDKSDFYLTDAYKWLMDNSDKYGFILRYSKDKQKITSRIYEPWHFRYVGESHAKKIKKLGVCLEEYIDILCSSKKPSGKT